MTLSYNHKNLVLRAVILKFSDASNGMTVKGTWNPDSMNFRMRYTVNWLHLKIESKF